VQMDAARTTWGLLSAWFSEHTRSTGAITILTLKVSCGWAVVCVNCGVGASNSWQSRSTALIWNWHTVVDLAFRRTACRGADSWQATSTCVRVNVGLTECRILVKAALHFAFLIQLPTSSNSQAADPPSASVKILLTQRNYRRGSRGSFSPHLTDLSSPLEGEPLRPSRRMLGP
jgi:hypothetical protein